MLTVVPKHPDRLVGQYEALCNPDEVKKWRQEPEALKRCKDNWQAWG